MLLRTAQAVKAMIDMTSQQHRVVQSCFVVCVCVSVIGYTLVWHGSDNSATLAGEAMRWAFGVLVSTVAVFHGSTVLVRHIDLRPQAAKADSGQSLDQSGDLKDKDVQQ